MVQVIDEPVAGFQELSLKSAIQDALQRAGFTAPTPVQTAFIPKALDGQDVIGQAQTGTGKTAAFLLPILNAISEDASGGPQALILVPTRELVVQVTEEAKRLRPSQWIRPLAIYGGQRFREQLMGLKKGCHIAIGTPGRVIDHLRRGTLTLNNIKFAVLDEADRMLDIGFRPDIEKILRKCPKKRQTMLLSATMSLSVQRIARRYMIEPEMVDVSPERLTVESIRQSYITVDKERKFDLLLKVIEREQPRQCIIFSQTKRGADRLFWWLREEGLNVATIHGDLPQHLRNRIMQGFRGGHITHLVATDVVGRGIDVNGISHIINYDLPEDPENYVHRIGRTGRMGSDGIAISFVTTEQGERLTAIEMLINWLITEEQVDGFEAVEPREEPEEKPPALPVFGRRTKRYRRAL